MEGDVENVEHLGHKSKSHLASAKGWCSPFKGAPEELAFSSLVAKPREEVDRIFKKIWTSRKVSSKCRIITPVATAAAPPLRLAHLPAAASPPPSAPSASASSLMPPTLPRPCSWGAVNSFMQLKRPHRNNLAPADTSTLFFPLPSPPLRCMVGLFPLLHALPCLQTFHGWCTS